VRFTLRPAGLSDREIDVLRLLARGQEPRQIADALGMASQAVDNHIQNMYAKAGVSTRAGATLFAMRNALLETTLPG
jgi:DNA-binding NarL/FixJ family response regulator